MAAKVPQPMCASAVAMASGPSSPHDKARNGSGGTRLAHTTKANWFMGP